MKNYLRILLAGFCLSCNGAPAFANFAMSPSGATTLFAVDAANQGTSLCAAASTECGASVPINTAGSPLFTASVPGVVNVGQINGITPLMGNGVTGTGSPRVTIASDNTAFSVNLGTIGGTATAANQATEIASLATIATNTGAAIPAGESHIGEIGGNQIRVQVAQTVTASSAYASGNAVGGLMTIAGAARVSGSLGAAGTGGILQNVAVDSKSAQTAAMEVWIFDANPSGSTCTDKTGFVLATADFDKVIGVAAVPTTAANNSGWFSGSTGSVGQANNQAMAYDLSSATSLFGCMVTRGTPTFAATTDISLKYNFLRN